MKIKYPDYNNSIVNLICSVLKHYGVESNHETLEVFDNYLKKDYKNIVVVLLDGLGVDALEKHLEESDFLRRHFVTGISTVFPPTTTAAVTSIESGLTPIEHGWLGWSLYFKELDKIVNAFINTVSGSGEKAADYHVAQRVLPYKTVYQKINEVGNARAYSVSPFGTNKVSNIDEMFSEIERLCGINEKKYVFAYSQQPDKDMHEYGCYSCEANSWIKKLDKEIENMCKNLEDTLVIITADHGHIDLKHKFISDYPELSNMMIRPISIESRAVCFHVKEEYRSKFKEEFYKSMGDEFLLFSREEVREKRIFGEGKEHHKFNEFMGDFLAVANGNYGILNSNKSTQFVSNHAGITEQEMMVPFIAIELD